MKYPQEWKLPQWEKNNVLYEWEIECECGGHLVEHKVDCVYLKDAEEELDSLWDGEKYAVVADLLFGINTLQKGITALHEEVGRLRKVRKDLREVLEYLFEDDDITMSRVASIFKLVEEEA